jgi:tetratricopeptide (TPR) repeat protein
VTGLDGGLEEFGLLWESAGGGNVDAMMKLADLCDGEMGRDWLRRAAEGGNRQAPRDLAAQLARAGRLDEAVPWYERVYEGGDQYVAAELSEVLLSLGRLDEAERLARQATETRPWRGNQCLLARVLLQLGRLEEAESWARRAVEGRAAFSEPLRVLADVLDRQGNSDEAEQLRAQARSLVDPEPDGIGAPPPLDVLAAAVSVGVIPFVNAMMSKAGEDTYGRVRALVRWLFDRGRPTKKGYWSGQNRLLIVEDPDPKLSLAIWFGTDTPDEQLRALKNFDVDSVAADAQRRNGRGVRIQWNEASRSWRARDQ